ncbi:MAG: 16S rRNA (guanine(527)-N(7))-methyltransferase RsmG [Pseudomonadota bacterium]
MPPKFDISVSRETEEKLEIYLALLKKWQPKINLISPQTLNEAWQRHFIDSMQLESLVSNDIKTIYDLGCGAGFPGLVLAIMRPDINIHLVESDQKKCSFLKTVSRETNCQNVQIHNCRIEDVSRETLQSGIPDMVSARALASINKLLDYCEEWLQINPSLEFLFPKGAHYKDEIEEARQSWDFDFNKIQSKTSSEAKILLLNNVQRK